MADLQLRVMGEDAASSAFSSMASSVRAAGQVLIDFTRQSVRAYAESERSQRQLELVAKGLTGAFSQQAKQMAELNAVSDESVAAIQTMLLRYGEAPAAVNATAQAVLDYAAATGTDAKAATDMLTRGVESGTGHFKSLGIAIEATGDRTKDLAAATAALAKRYGGAGVADAESLSGQVRGAGEAFGELQETFGSFIASAESKLGVISSLTEALKGLNYAIAGQFDDEETALKQDTYLAEVMKNADDIRKARAALVEAEKNGTMEDEKYARFELEAMLAQAEELKSRHQGVFFPGAISAGTPNPTGAGGGRVRGGGGADSRPMLGPDAPDSDFFSAVEGPAAPSGEQWAQMQQASMDARAEEFASYGDAFKRTNDEVTSMLRQASSHVDAALAEMKSKQSEFAAAGQALGNAFASSLSQAVESLAAGEEMDMGQTVASILSSILPVIGTIAGTAIGGPMGGTIGGGLGQLFGAGARGLARNPGVTVNTMDAQSAREFFERDGGKAFYDAVRTGRGSLGRT